MMELIAQNLKKRKKNKMELALIKNNIKIEWTELGEGLSGDYDSDDPDDFELLRFDVSLFKNGEWSEINDASYCTMFPVNTTERHKIKGLIYLMDEIYEYASVGNSIKKLCEKLSWIDPFLIEGINER